MRKSQRLSCVHALCCWAKSCNDRFSSVFSSTRGPVIRAPFPGDRSLLIRQAQRAPTHMKAREPGKSEWHQEADCENDREKERTCVCVWERERERERGREGEGCVHLSRSIPHRTDGQTKDCVGKNEKDDGRSKREDERIKMWYSFSCTTVIISQCRVCIQGEVCPRRHYCLNKYSFNVAGEALKSTVC